MNLDKYKAAFIEKLTAQCMIYATIGCGIDESPMWFQYRGVQNNLIRFDSSQTTEIWFELPLINETDFTNLQYGDFQKFYEYFRDMKYDFIKEKFPTIYKEIKG